MEIKLSEYNINVNEELKNKTLVVDLAFEKNGGNTLTFENCTFKFTNQGSLDLTSCLIRNCIFQGIKDCNSFDSGKGNIRINGCKNFNKNQLIGQFKSSNIVNSLIFDFKDYSTTNDYEISISEISDSNIEGSCRVLNLSTLIFQSSKNKTSLYDKIINLSNLIRESNKNKTSFFDKTINLSTLIFHSSKNKTSLFDKKIILRADCHNVVFDNVNVNPFYFATKCAVKSSIDFSKATLIDNWSRLRKKYAGLSLFIVFMLTFLFLLPLFTHSFFLLIFSKVEISQIEIKKIPLWEALLFGGKEGWYAILYSCLTITLLLYNIGRLYMTISIAKLREEERFLKDSNFQLISIHPEKIKKQIFIDKILSFIFYVSITYTFLKLIDTLMIEVPLFK